MFRYDLQNRHDASPYSSQYSFRFATSKKEKCDKRRQPHLQPITETIHRVYSASCRGQIDRSSEQRNVMSETITPLVKRSYHNTVSVDPIHFAMSDEAVLTKKRTQEEIAVETNTPKAKRPKRKEGDSTPPVSLVTLNDDCLLNILSYATRDELNSTVVFVSKRFRNLRAHESLDQEREATIVLKMEYCLLTLSQAIFDNNWDLVFQGNYTSLQIVNLWVRDDDNDRFQLSVRWTPLTNVKKLRLTGYSEVHHAPSLWRLFPNLEELDLTNKAIERAHIFFRGLVRACPHLTKLTWNYERECSPSNLNISGADFCKGLALTELDLDSCWFDLYGLPGRTGDFYMFMHCSCLERLSMKGAMIQFHSSVGLSYHRMNIPQGMLIEMVRRHPTLRWLRSDLSAENVAMLREERPDITFVSD